MHRTEGGLHVDVLTEFNIPSTRDQLIKHLFDCEFIIIQHVLRVWLCNCVSEEKSHDWSFLKGIGMSVQYQRLSEVCHTSWKSKEK